MADGQTVEAILYGEIISFQ